MSHLFRYAKEIQENSVAKGFWDEGPERSKGEMVMLMVSELGECLDAHRAGKFYNNVDDLVGKNQNQFFLTLFKNHCKSTVQDEMADVAIRVLDYVYGWKITVYDREFRKESTGNFANDLLRINHYIIQAYHDVEAGRDWGYTLSAIEKFCEWYKIDLEKHIQWKIKYNAQRPHKHGKAY